jgi:5'-nucleotidase
MEENIIIVDPEKLEKTKELIRRDGFEKFYVISDFDRTLTTAFVDGKSAPSLISILRDGNFLTPDYAEKAHVLYNKYHPIEIDPNIEKEEKKKLMHEWWSTHFDLLIKSGLNKKDLEKVVDSGKIKFREDFEEFSDFLNRKNIPLIIISSSGIGGEVISLYLKKAKKLYNNTYILSNSYEWDKDGKAIAVKKPIIHGMNKNGELIKSSPFFKIIGKRKNILLLGDSLDDVDMIKGLDYENLIKVSFLNEDIEGSIDKYKLYYDTIALNDSSMFFVNNLLKELIK